jgi:hypothetical protein
MSAGAVISFVDAERAKNLVRSEPVVFAEIVCQAGGERSLEVHVLRRAGPGLHEVERDDTGPMPNETVEAFVAKIAAAHGCRYATIYPAEDRWPPAWAFLGERGALARPQIRD